MAQKDPPVTAAIRFLRAKGVAFEPHAYDYVEKGGTARSSAELGVDEHSVVKTLVFETDAKEPLIVLMHGDRQVSTKKLARDLGVRSIQPCKPETAEKVTGYQFGGTSPFSGRTQDSAGLAFGYMALSDDLADVLDPLLEIRDEWEAELYYQLALESWCVLTADLQLVRPFQDDVDVTLVPGARLQLVF